ncbi:MAG: cysteine desulfurase [Phycisphaeraceae bacterium]|nr:cysteine desulfurase [Phycisphaerae bacterium]MBX3392730.1 cysteine desulfurase [Phycisphaeraceae bacterium]
MINLDNNATTRPCRAAVEAARRGLETCWHNPSSVHRGGQEARRLVELARQDMADLIGAKARDVVLTSGGTESIDLAVRGVLAAFGKGSEPPVLVTTRVEHAAVRDLVEALAESGAARVVYAPVDGRGVVDVAGFALAAEGARVAVVQWANNETGAIQPVGAIAAICRSRGIRFVCDGTQWVGKLPADVGESASGPAACACDLLVISPHKFHGPKGVGALWIRPGVRVRPGILGSQELGRRGGTENVPGILGAGAAAREASAWLADASLRAGVEAIRERFESRVLGGVRGAVVNGPTEPGARLWNTTNIGFPPIEAEVMVLHLSERGVAVSAGAACSSGSLEPSAVLLAMGVPEVVAHGSVRFSFSRETTEAEADAAADLVIQAALSLGVAGA